MTSKGASLKRRPSGHMRANAEECHDAIEEDDASSNTPPRKVGIEDMLRHKHNRDISIDMKDKIGLLKGRVGPRALTSKVEVSEGIWSCGSGVKSVHMKYEYSPSLVSIGHWTDNARRRMTPHENHVYSCMGERAEMSVSGRLPLKWVFEGQYQTARVCRYCALARVLEVATYTCYTSDHGTWKVFFILVKNLEKNLSQTLSSHIQNLSQVWSLIGFHNPVLRSEDSGEDIVVVRNRFVRQKEFELQKFNLGQLNKSGNRREAEEKDQGKNKNRTDGHRVKERTGRRVKERRKEPKTYYRLPRERVKEKRGEQSLPQSESLTLREQGVSRIQPSCLLSSLQESERKEKDQFQIVFPSGSVARPGKRGYAGEVAQVISVKLNEQYRIRKGRLRSERRISFIYSTVKQLKRLH
ncbi:hypothetical protein SDJN02_16135, partial [Cucurbita argyrosperma subsp. argyrosperma]